MLRIFKILVFCGLLVPSLSAQEEQWYLGKPIADIRFEGLSHVSHTELLGIVRPYYGEEFSDALSWEIQSSLYTLDYFDLIIPRIIPGDEDSNTVVLVLEIEEKPVVGNVLFTGNQKIQRGTLLDAVLEKRGDVFNSGTLSLDEQAILDLYLEKGFVQAAVATETQLDEESNTVRIIFNIQEGYQTKISEIHFVGNDKHISDAALRRLISTKPQSLFRKGLFVETKLQEDIKLIEQYYGDQGFIDAKVIDVDRTVVFNEEKNVEQLIITIVIEEGEPWTYGGVSFVGNQLYTTEELEAQSTQNLGEIFNRTQYQIDYQKITDLYLENGYIFNQFLSEENRNEETRTISFVVRIVERERAHVGDFTIRGNTKTKSYFIRREFPLDEGEVFSKTKVLEGINNLRNTGFFEVVDVQPYPGSDESLMDLIVDVTEAPTVTVGAGIAFYGGPDFPISGNVTWEDRNFLGRGQSLAAQLNFSLFNQSVSVRFNEPRILGLRWSGGVNLSYVHYIHNRIHQDLDGNGVPDPYATWEEYEKSNRVVPEDALMRYDSHLIETGVSTGYAWNTSLGRLGAYTGLGFSWEYVIYPSHYTPFSSRIRGNLLTWLYSDSLWLQLTWDTRDLLYDPSKGFIISQRITFAGIIPSSSRHFIKTTSRYDHHFTLFDIPVGKSGKSFKSILQLHTAFRALLPKPGRSIDTQSDGYNFDGIFLARGWSPVIDGQYLWDNTVQLVFPIIERILSFDVFLDIVGLWKTTEALKTMTAHDFYFSLGWGFRFANPQFPIGIYLTKKFRPRVDGSIDWNPEPGSAEIKGLGLDLVIAFDIDIY